MNRQLKRVLTLGTASAIFVLGLTGSALAEHPKSKGWGGGGFDSVAAPEMNLGSAGNGLLLFGGAMLLLMENYRRHRKH